METTAAWAPCEFQLANWTVQEQAAEVWAPPCLPMEYASIDIFGYSCSLQAYVPESCVGQQLVEYHSSADSQHNGPGDEAQWSSEVIHGHNRVMTENCSADVVVDLHIGEAKISDDSSVSCILKRAASKVKVDIDTMQVKMHRYPAILQDVHESYTVPRIVVIGPYHRDRVQFFKKAQEVKHAAVYHCARQSGLLVEELYGAVRSAADNAFHLYDEDVMAGISCQDFMCMMFLDACFLVQYILVTIRGPSNALPDDHLYGFLNPNRMDIFHDIMLLENQIPWEVVKTVLSFNRIPLSDLELFVASCKGILKDLISPTSEEKRPAVSWSQDYKPPHLLGLIRYYIVGRRDTELPRPKTSMKSISESAIELTKIGVKLTANKTYDLFDMGLNQEGTFFPKLSLAPLTLDRDRASYLINMAAHELCTVKSFGFAPREEDSAVCSCLTLLAMLVSREEDVHQLRKSGVLQGGGGLTNEDALRFFSSYQGMRFGPCYTRIMQQIESYREDKGVRAWFHTFFYNYWKIIVTVVTVIGTFFTIILPLVTIKHA